MALCSYDEAYTIPTEYSQRISLRTMQLLIEEMGLAETVDPLGGSFYVETLTNEMRAKMERDHGRDRRRRAASSSWSPRASSSPGSRRRPTACSATSSRARSARWA